MGRAEQPRRGCLRHRRVRARPGRARHATLPSTPTDSGGDHDGRDHAEGRRRDRVAGVLRPARRRRRGRSSPRATPTVPLDRAEGFRMLTRLLRGALESKLEYGRRHRTGAGPRLPRDDQDRRREPRQPLPRRVARRAVRLPDLGHPRRRQVDQLQPVLRRRLRRRRARARATRCTRSRCTSSPTAPSS